MKKIGIRYLPECILCLFLFLFVVLKLDQISLPYFWDELGVYARGALYLHDHGVSLLPASLDPQISRGHPLLYNAINASAFTVFGDTTSVGHTTALVISLWFILLLYFSLKSVFNGFVSLIICSSFLLQPLFIAQSTLLLPEVILGMCMWGALYFFYRNNMFFYVVFSCAAILIKESAVIIPVVVLLSGMLVQLAERHSIRKFIQWKYLFAIIPYFIYGIFLLIQKQQNGWYFFPYHIDSVKFYLPFNLLQLGDFSKFILMEQGRIYFTGSVLILYGLYICFQYKKLSLPLVHAFLFFISCAAFLCLYNDLDAAFTVLFYVAGMLIIFKFIYKNSVHPFMIYLLLFMGVGITFSSLSFYMNRYILFLLPVFFALCYYAIQNIPFAKWIHLILLFIVSFYAYRNMESDTFHYDEDMSYVNYVTLQETSISYLEPMLHDTTLLYANFPMYHCFLDPRLGFTELIDKQDLKLSMGINAIQNADYILIANPGSYDFILPDSIYLDCLKSFENATGSFKIYKRNEVNQTELN